MKTISKKKYKALLQEPHWCQHVRFFDGRRTQHDNAWREYVGTAQGVDYVVDVTVG